MDNSLVLRQDKAGNSYVEIQGFRCTWVPEGWTGGPCLRIQAYRDTGTLQMGPEIPVDGGVSSLIHGIRFLEESQGVPGPIEDSL